VIPIAIVAHPKRTHLANRLAEYVEAEAVLWDNEGRGVNANHLDAWHWLAEGDPREFAVVLEDDAMPCREFREQLDMVLAVAPAGVVSLYLGTGYPRQWQDSIATSVNPIGFDPHFLTAPVLLSGVGYAVHAELIEPMISSVSKRATVMPIDEAIGVFCRDIGHRVAYTNPSIVNHIDGESLIAERRDQQARTGARRAYRFGLRPHWDGVSMPIPEPELAYVDVEGRHWYRSCRKEYL
jgi:hypothetical protein